MTASQQIDWAVVQDAVKAAAELLKTRVPYSLDLLVSEARKLCQEMQKVDDSEARAVATITMDGFSIPDGIVGEVVVGVQEVLGYERDDFWDVMAARRHARHPQVLASALRRLKPEIDQALRLRVEQGARTDAELEADLKAMT